MSIEVGVDIGGTFTDLVCRAAGAPDRILKVPSTPGDPARAVLDGIARLRDELGIEPAELARVVHGTTVATNAVLERKGARTGLIASEGFRDVLEIGRQMRTALYELSLAPETPVFLAPRARRAEVRERLSASGEVVTPLDEATVLGAAERLVAAGVESVAVCLLFSFLDPRHEQRVRELLAERHPELTVSLSSEVDPAFREYERTVVTAFDAYVKPVLSRYLARMGESLAAEGVRAPLQVMQSRGGVSGEAVAAERPVRLFLSGPAAGVIGGLHCGRAAGFDDVITVDIGGTSCDIALISGGTPVVRADGHIDGFPVRVPMVDVNAIGAGGGSIAWIDAAGGLRVGPHSAGADPGPACYGRGGEEATVTDASLVLGYLDPDYFAAGTVKLDAGRAREIIESRIAGPLGLDARAAALGIHRIVNAQMAEGIRLVSIRRGFDPRDFALIALGGGGPVHATVLAEELGIATVVVPRHPGVLSAAGLLAAPVEHEVSQGFPRDLADVAAGDVRAVLDELDRRCAELMAAEQVETGAVRIAYAADVCFVGQSHHLEVPLDMDEREPMEGLYRRFIAHHEQVFGYAAEAPARLVNLRSVHRAGGLDQWDDVVEAQAEGAAVKGEREVLLRDADGPVKARVYNRSTLAAGYRFQGPAIVEQADTTTVVHPGWAAQVLASGELVLTRSETETR
ncbi:MAG: hydantoinase/oxoprolinase family protein [Gammaproteobacteria bacterium]|nr:hydantoinase/oxoprolinase family protein [Gammaproteobacteria bacterium]